MNCIVETSIVGYIEIPWYEFVGFFLGTKKISLSEIFDSIRKVLPKNWDVRLNSPWDDENTIEEDSNNARKHVHDSEESWNDDIEDVYLIFERSVWENYKSYDNTKDVTTPSFNEIRGLLTKLQIPNWEQYSIQYSFEQSSE